MRYKQYCPICEQEWKTFKKPFIVAWNSEGQVLYKYINECKKCNKKLKEL